MDLQTSNRRIVVLSMHSSGSSSLGAANNTTTSSSTTSSSTNSSVRHPSQAEEVLTSSVPPSLRQRHIKAIGDGGRGSSTTSSSTEETEARERRFGSIDLHQPLIKGPSPAATGTTDRTRVDSLVGDAVSGVDIDPQLRQALLADFGRF